MKKCDLRTGMRVVTRNRDSYVVMKNFKSIDQGIIDVLVPLVECTPGGVLFLMYYTDDLLRQCNRNDLDIMEVWNSRFDEVLRVPSNDQKKYLLWKRESEVIELALEDIAKKFEVDVKQIKIKK